MEKTAAIMDSVEEILEEATPTSATKDGLKRTRELQRYLSPATLSSAPMNNPRACGSIETPLDDFDPTPSLLPFVQLTALRCNTSKAFLNVIDADTMYFLAEVNKRPYDRLSHAPMFESSQDAALVGCSTMSLEGRICELTIQLQRSEKCRYPCLTISDLSKDDRFSQLDIVVGGPKFRFYCGTPVVTREGINIGTIAVMDPEPRDRLSADEEQCLGETAEHVMDYLELNREAIEGRQSRRMGSALNNFVAGKGTLADLKIEGPRRQPSLRSSFTKEESASASHTPHPPQASQVRIVRKNRFPDIEHQSVEEKPGHIHAHKPSSSDKSDSEDSPPTSILYESFDPSNQHQADALRETEEINSRTHSKTFARAANLLREALELGTHGGVLFVNVTSEQGVPTFLSDVKTSFVDESSSTGDDCGYKRAAFAKLDEIIHSPTFMKYSNSVPASTLASSTIKTPLCEGPAPPADGGIKLDSDVVNYFVGRYPGGRLLILEDDDGESLSAETAQEVESHGGTRSSRLRRKAAEIEFLRRALPQARQLLIVPLWDASEGRISSACFVWASSKNRLFSPRYELSYLTSFCQTLMAECSRIDAIAADRQKGSFVGIISHELRSPLHGILASVELLSENELTNFQESIVNTIDACGKTLLDTINHVLDFSKINSFEKSWQASNRVKDKSKNRIRSAKPDPLGGSDLANTAPPLLQLYGVTDISVVLEEVIEGITAGFTYNHNIDLTDTSKKARGRDSQIGADMDAGMQASSKGDAISVIIDMEPGDWVFMTQPGAVRRIIMNIFGNAIKYTTHGSVKVRLEFSKPHVVLTITDTGRGISPQFLNSRLFMPFAQENALAPGTGLGLSICKSIVTMLGGYIDVQSRLNSGTTVKVKLPLVRPNDDAGSTDGTSLTSHSSIFSTPDRAVPDIKKCATTCRIALYQADETDQHVSRQELVSVLKKYITGWFGLQIVDLKSKEANIVLMEEEHLQRFGEECSTLLDKVAVIALCNDASKRSLAFSTAGSYLTKVQVLEYLPKPVGPHKLAKVIKACLRKLGGFDVDNSMSPPAQNEAADTDIAEQLNHLSLKAPQDRLDVNASEPFPLSPTSQRAQSTTKNPLGRIIRTVDEAGDLTSPTLTSSARSSRHASQRSFRHQQGQTSEISDQLEPIREHPLKPQPMHPVLDSTATPNPRMLIVDDNAINIKILHTFLKKRKCTQIASAENGAIAVELFTSAPADRRYQIVLIDISMPVMNGFEATRAIRDFEDKTKVAHPAMIVALTGLASAKDQAEGLASGMDVYLTKPVSIKEVGRLLDAWALRQKNVGSDG